MKNQLQPKEYKRFTPEPIGTDNTLEAVLNMTIESLKMGRPPAYPETEQGLEDFKRTTIDYFQYVKDTNANPNIDKITAVEAMKQTELKKNTFYNLVKRYEEAEN